MVASVQSHSPLQFIIISVLGFTNKKLMLWDVGERLRDKRAITASDSILCARDNRDSLSNSRIAYTWLSKNITIIRFTNQECTWVNKARKQTLTWWIRHSKLPKQPRAFVLFHWNTGQHFHQTKRKELLDRCQRFVQTPASPSFSLSSSAGRNKRIQINTRVPGLLLSALRFHNREVPDYLEWLGKTAACVC